MKYSYEVIDKNGGLVVGDLEAANKRAAIRSLLAEGLTVVQVEAPRPNKQPLYQRKLKQQEVIIALFELATLLESGVSIAEAIESQSQSEYHPVLNLFFEKVAKGLRRGDSLSASMSGTTLDLPEFFIRLVQAGELSGKLSSCLKKGVDQMEYELDINAQFQSALIYPMILAFSGLAAVLLIFVFVVPKFSNLLEGGNDLPTLAWFVLTTGMWFNEYFKIIIIASVALLMAILGVLRKPIVRQKLREFAANLPVLGGWISEVEIAKWSSVMAAMLESRVELVAALEMARKSVQIQTRRRKLQSVSKAVRSGELLSKSLRENKILSPIAYNLIGVGEKTGNLDGMLHSVAKVYDVSCKNRMKTVVALIEPLAILIIGILIGVLVLGIILAITSVNTVSI